MCVCVCVCVGVCVCACMSVCVYVCVCVCVYVGTTNVLTLKDTWLRRSNVGTEHKVYVSQSHD